MMNAYRKDELLWCIFWSLIGTAGLAMIAIGVGCGSSMDLTELARIRAITCPSVCAPYADAVDAGVEVTPEDEALIGVCGCGVGE